MSVVLISDFVNKKAVHAWYAIQLGRLKAALMAAIMVAVFASILILRSTRVFSWEKLGRVWSDTV